MTKAGHVAQRVSTRLQSEAETSLCYSQPPTSADCSPKALAEIKTMLLDLGTTIESRINRLEDNHRDIFDVVTQIQDESEQQRRQSIFNDTETRAMLSGAKNNPRELEDAFVKEENSDDEIVG